MGRARPPAATRRASSCPTSKESAIACRDSPAASACWPGRAGEAAATSCPGWQRLRRRARWSRSSPSPSTPIATTRRVGRRHQAPGPRSRSWWTMPTSWPEALRHRQHADVGVDRGRHGHRGAGHGPRPVDRLMNFTDVNTRSTDAPGSAVGTRRRDRRLRHPQPNPWPPSGPGPHGVASEDHLTTLGHDGGPRGPPWVPGSQSHPTTGRPPGVVPAAASTRSSPTSSSAARHQQPRRYRFPGVSRGARARGRGERSRQEAQALTPPAEGWARHGSTPSEALRDG